MSDFKAAIERAKAIAENIKKQPQLPQQQQSAYQDSPDARLKRSRDYPEDYAQQQGDDKYRNTGADYYPDYSQQNQRRADSGYSRGSQESEILIPIGSVGLVIGRKGETLKAIQSQTRTRIEVQEDSNIDGKKRVIITGSSLEDVEDAKRMIEDKASDRGFRQDSSSDHHYSSGKQESMTIPASKVGLVIGKQAATLKDLQMKSGAKIFVPKDRTADPNPNERVIFLSGPAEAIQMARSLITQIVSGGGSFDSGYNSQQQSYKHTFKMDLSQDQAGIIIGRDGETIKALQQYSKCKITVEKSTGPSRPLTIMGDEAQVEYARQLVSDTLDNGEFIPPSDFAYQQQQQYPYQAQDYSQAYGNYGAGPQGQDSAAYYASLYQQQAGMSQADYQKQYADYYAAYAAYYQQAPTSQPTGSNPDYSHQYGVSNRDHDQRQ